jgi:hypothetical protein
MLGNKSKAQVEEKDQDEDKSEVLGNLVKVVVLIWSASLLTFSYVRLPNGQKILDFDPTFIASVFSGSLAAFGLSPAKAGGGGANGNAKTQAKKEPEVVSAVEPKEKPQ